MIRSMGWDLGLPLVAYYGLHALGASDTAALLAGTGIAGLRMGWIALRHRRLSPFSFVMAAVFGVGLLFTVVTGDPRFMLVKHSAMAAALGLAFLVTAARGRPLTLSAQQSFQPRRARELAEAYAGNPMVRHGHRVASVVWGAGLLAEATVRVVLVYALPIDVMVGVSTGLTVVTFGVLIGWNARYVAGRTRTSGKPAPAREAQVQAVVPAELGLALEPAQQDRDAVQVGGKVDQ
jgi:drug/metabolite transporter (DMT)-like permease